MNLDAIQLLAFDVDGVMTDGKILLSPDGQEFKAFCAQDGAALRWLAKAGFRVAIISGRSSNAVQVRARDLGIERVYLGVHEKRVVLSDLLVREGLGLEQVSYMGDDLMDLPVLTQVGWSITVPEAPVDVRERVDYVTTLSGGAGAVREMVEHFLRHRGLWDSLVAEYLE